MKKVISNNLKNILAGSLIAGTLVGLNSCNETQKAEDLGNGDSVRDAVDEAGNTVEEVAKEVEGKCGEGKCGEGKCGEGMCGGSSDEEAKTTEGKCGEGKCGEGKCGEE